nr:unnamed protein product [Callosobruchus analis]
MGKDVVKDRQGFDDDDIDIGKRRVKHRFFSRNGCQTNQELQNLGHIGIKRSVTMVNTRKGVHHDDYDQQVVINFLKSEQFSEIIERAITAKVSVLLEKISELEKCIQSKIEDKQQCVEDAVIYKEVSHETAGTSDLNSTLSSNSSNDTVVEQKTGWELKKVHGKRQNKQRRNIDILHGQTDQASVLLNIF